MRIKRGRIPGTGIFSKEFIQFKRQMDQRFMSVYKPRLQSHIDALNNHETNSVMSIDHTENEFQLEWHLMSMDDDQSMVFNEVRQWQADIVTDQPQMFI